MQFILASGFSVVGMDDNIHVYIKEFIEKLMNEIIIYTKQYLELKISTARFT